MVLKSPKLILTKLVLVGRLKRYTVNFNVGINIIHGDSDTGKSSILNLIDYLLGSKKIYMYDEIEQHGKYAMLEVLLNNKVYTIKRNIFEPKENIEVYSSSIENMNNVFPLEYSPNYDNEGPAGYFSDFLLSSLNIPIITVKQAPSKDNSPMVRLSFRDIFKYCYFDQDDVGNKEILDRKNPTLVVKNKETFKFIHNVLDTQITELQNMIGEKNREKKELNNKYNVISSFFLETRLSTEESLRGRKSDIEDKVHYLENERINITEAMQADNQEMEELRILVLELEKELNIILSSKLHKETQLEQNFRLKKEYQSDFTKLQTALKVKKSLSLQHLEIVECPLCNSIMETVDLKKHFVEHNEDVLKKEINSIRNKIKEINSLNDNLRDELFLMENRLLEEKERLFKAKSTLDLSAKEYISPYIAQRDIIVTELSTLKEQLDKNGYFLKIRMQLKEIKEKEDVLNNQIKELNVKLGLLKEQSPSIEDTLFGLGTYLREFLEFIPIKNAYGIRLSQKTFLPIVRDRDYTDLTSGGLRTLVSLSYIISLLKNSMNKETNYPSLIMIDTVGKYLGKTKKNTNDVDENKENKKEELDDPKKYLRIYKYLEKMSTDFIKTGNEHQIILVDNDFPENLEIDYDQYVVKRFGVEEKDGYEKGFINNATSIKLN